MDSKPTPKPYSLNESAIALHEFFTSLVAAGFTPEQAVYLVGQWLGRGPNQ